MPEKTYEDGLRDGQIKAMESMLHDHKGRLDNHSQRLRLLERIVWALGGAMALVEYWPVISQFVMGGGA